MRAMLPVLKAKLTLWFVVVLMVMYALASFIGILLLNSVLHSTNEQQARELLDEIAPSVTFENGRPTLRAWAERLKEVDEKLHSTIQLYDENKTVTEVYGPPGIRHLVLQSELDKDTHIISRYTHLMSNGKVAGYIQVQESTAEIYQYTRQLSVVLLILAPFVIVAIGSIGYLVVGKALEPTERMMSRLRQFVADAGHELNTPIAIIEASVETLEATLQDHGLPTEVLDPAANASRRMKDLAANLILLARMESPRQFVQSAPISVKEFVEPVIQEYAEFAKRKNIELVCQTLPGVIIVGDLESLKRMLNNLLQNAVRYTEPGGRVNVSVNKTDNDIEVIVEDSGIGIPRESLDHVFDRFYRADKSRTRETGGGSGLGLSIVQAIVEAHKGQISVKSIVGQGSKFTVTLPRHS
jgi:two-component system, OmpR family, manganese sensing sensor histidine kinase